MDITTLIIQVLAGIAGGNAVGKGAQNLDLGTLGNSIAGAIGGAGGAILTAIIAVVKNMMSGQRA